MKMHGHLFGNGSRTLQGAGDKEIRALITIEGVGAVSLVVTVEGVARIECQDYHGSNNITIVVKQ